MPFLYEIYILSLCQDKQINTVMNISKNKNRIADQVRKGLDLAGPDSLYAFGNEEDAVTCLVQFDETDKYLVAVKNSGHFYITSQFDSQNFLLKAYIKSEDDLDFIAQTIKLVFQAEDEDEQFL